MAALGINNQQKPAQASSNSAPEELINRLDLKQDDSEAGKVNAGQEILAALGVPPPTASEAVEPEGSSMEENRGVEVARDVSVEGRQTDVPNVDGTERKGDMSQEEGNTRGLGSESNGVSGVEGLGGKPKPAPLFVSASTSQEATKDEDEGEEEEDDETVESSARRGLGFKAEKKAQANAAEVPQNPGAPVAVEAPNPNGAIGAENLGFQMLMRMGWNTGKGLGSRGSGTTQPVLPAENTNGSKGAGLAHASEVNPFKPKDDPTKLESWEFEEKIRDFHLGSGSSIWMKAGTLEDCKLKAKKETDSLRSPKLMTYQDAWDDTKVSVLTRGKDNEEIHNSTWEDAWAEGVNSDLEERSLNTQHFFACCTVTGEMVQMLHIEPTGEVFQSKVWASTTVELKSILEQRLQSRLRVLRPLFKGRSSIFTVVQKAAGEDEEMLNREATRIQGCNIYGSVYILCRNHGRQVVSYSLRQYLSDFVKMAR